MHRFPVEPTDFPALTSLLDPVQKFNDLAKIQVLELGVFKDAGAVRRVDGVVTRKKVHQTRVRRPEGENVR